jgi:hypothetical protein
VFGNPILAAPPPTVLQAPPLAVPVPVPYNAPGAQDPSEGDGTGTSLPPTTVSARDSVDETRDIPVVGTGQDQVVRHVGDYGPPASLAPVSAITGRPVRGAWRRRRQP